MRIAFDEAKAALQKVLQARQCPRDKAEKIAHEVARNDLEGTYTHGINRFARLVRSIDDGLVRVDADPVRLHGYGAIENYDGQAGFGVTNACFSMGRAIELAEAHGIGFVALRHTNHWMRAATYGYQACDAGMAGICFTNTLPNMPTWGAVDSRLGNTPLVLAFPREGGHVLVDMAMSQFSYGALELARLQGRSMPFDAGYDREGGLTRDPQEVILSRRILPTGYWKGAALSFVLDVFAGCMSLGNTVAGISRLQGDEHGVSQVFLAIDFQKIAPKETTEAILADDIAYLLGSAPDKAGSDIRYPGQKALRIRQENLALGIPVDECVWKEILAL